jgi:amino acid transporter
VKQLITRIRNTDRRNLTIAVTVIAIFGALNWALGKLIGLIIDNNPSYNAINDAATSGYFIGFLAAFMVLDLMRWTDRTLRARFARKTPATTE